MQTTIKLDTYIDKLQEVSELLKQIDTQVDKLRFITIKEFSEITGWAPATVQNLYNRPDFPSCDYGKEKIALLSAVIKYFEVPRRRE